MKQNTQARIAALQKSIGVKPATDEHQESLFKLEDLAFALIQTVQAEKSGACHGDGHWYDYDPLAESVASINQAFRDVQTYRRAGLIATSEDTF